MLEQLVAANNDATLEALRYQLQQKTNVLLGRSTVERMLTKLISRLKNTPYPTAKESERVQQQRVDF